MAERICGGEVLLNRPDEEGELVFQFGIRGIEGGETEASVQGDPGYG